MNRFYCNTLCMGALTVGLTAMPSINAAVVTWDGVDGEYTDGINWDTDTVPNTAGGDTAVINAGNVNYTPGGDLTIGGGGSLQINGGSWTQSGGVAWIQVGDGSIVVSGGTFNQGTAGNIVLTGGGSFVVNGGTFNQGSGGFEVNATSSISVSAGTANLNGNLIYQPTTSVAVSLSGTGTINVAGEFKPVETFTMSSGTLDTALISFADGTGGINFTGGQISLDGAGTFSGFYAPTEDKSINFTTGSTGVLFFKNYTLADLAEDGFLTNNAIQYNGDIDAGAFNVFEVDGGVQVSLVPEPGALALIGMGLLSVAARRRNNH